MRCRLAVWILRVKTSLSLDVTPPILLRGQERGQPSQSSLVHDGSGCIWGKQFALFGRASIRCFPRNNESGDSVLAFRAETYAHLGAMPLECRKLLEVLNAPGNTVQRRKQPSIGMGLDCVRGLENTPYGVFVKHIEVRDAHTTMAPR